MAAPEPRSISITDSETGAPLPGVKATINPGNLVKTTAEGGGSYVTSLPAGNYTMSLVLEGYADTLVSFTVTDGQRVQLSEV